MIICWKIHLEESYRVTAYPKDIELKMQRFFARLSEKNKRSYEAIESAKLGRGGMEYVSGLFEKNGLSCATS
ncbi:MAG: hypothetical protein PSV18_15460 [Methylobacter sp.]|nr:hypothetical protein [Candidatus Methylobacter titanis]